MDFEAIYDAGDAVFHERFREVQEESEFHTGEAKVREKLFLVGVVHGFYTFYLEYDPVFDDDVCSESFREFQTSV